MNLTTPRARRRRSKTGGAILAAGALVAGAVPALGVTASQGTASVDGNASEWNLTADFASDMLRAGGNGGQTTVESKLYLRYDCAAETLYALVLASPGVSIRANLPDDQFIKVGGVGNNGPEVSGNTGDDDVTPDFRYVNRSGSYAQGWEASFRIAPGHYPDLDVHAQVQDGEQQTSAVPGRSIPLTLSCDRPAPKLTVSKTATATYHRRFDWTIAKQATPASITTPADTARIGYAVTVTKSAPVDWGFGVSGEITVTNPTAYAISGVDIVDSIVDGPGCAVSDGVDRTVPADSSIVVSYTCDLSAKVDGTNMATATWNDGASSATGSAAFTFGDPAGVQHATVDVTDAFGAEAAALLPGGDDLAESHVFNYERTVPVPAQGCATMPNLATVTSPDELVASASASVIVCREQTPPPPPPPPPPPVVPPAPPVVVVSGGPTPTPRLVIVKAGPRRAIAGQVVTYTIRVRNTGSADATSVRVRDILPRGFRVFGGVVGGTARARTVSWNLGTLAPGASKVLRVRVRVDRAASGRRCNVARASGSNIAVVGSRTCMTVRSIAGVSRVPAVTG